MGSLSRVRTCQEQAPLTEFVLGEYVAMVTVPSRFGASFSRPVICRRTLSLWGGNWEW